MPAEFIIPNCKIQSNFTFTMASSGDPSSFTFTMDAFPDYTRFNKEKKVLAAIQIISEDTEEGQLRRASTEASLEHEVGKDGIVVDKDQSSIKLNKTDKKISIDGVTYWAFNTTDYDLSVKDDGSDSYTLIDGKTYLTVPSDKYDLTTVDSGTVLINGKNYNVTEI